MLPIEPDSLTYFTRECATKQPISAHFRPLELADTTEVQGEAWRGIFSAMWSQIVETEALCKRACKLVCEKGSDKRIQGLLFIGAEQGANWSLGCLLEAAPWNQYERTDRLYCGVGKALVARVIAEHWYRGYHTPIQIESGPRSQLFYRAGASKMI